MPRPIPVAFYIFFQQAYRLVRVAFRDHPFYGLYFFHRLFDRLKS